MSTGTLTTSVSQISDPSGTSRTTGVSLGLEAPVGSGTIGGSFGRTNTSTAGGSVKGSEVGIWGTANPATGVSITGNIGLGTKDFPGGSSSTTNLGVTGTVGGTSLNVSSSKTGFSTGASSQTLSGTLGQTVPIGDNFGIKGTLGTAHTTGTQGTFNTNTMGIAGLANVGGGTASLGFNKSQTTGSGGFGLTQESIKLNFEKEISTSATIGGFLSTGSVSFGGGPSRPTSGGGISVGCKF